MSLNKNHHHTADNVVLFFGERLLIFYKGCVLKFGPPLKGSHNGRVYLTSHRVIFLNERSSAGLLSFSMPFVNMREVDIKQPVFGANKLVGKVRAEPDGGWQGEAEFSITFNHGGAIEFGRALIELGRRASSARGTFRPPPSYIDAAATTAAQYYSCPPPAYAPPYNDPYYGFVQQHESFMPPLPQTLYYTGAPPPYPGATPDNYTSWGPPPPASNGPTQTAMNFNTDPGQSANPNYGGVVSGGYHFNENPHTVFASPIAPPPSDGQYSPYPTSTMPVMESGQPPDIKKNQ